MYYGDFAEDDTVQIIFNTFTSDDPSASCTITNLVAGDIKIHKDGGVAQKASSDGVTVSLNFDGITGNHLISIDTSNDTGAAGFWVTGSEYQVRMEGTTVDGATINAWIGAFSIERAGGALALLKNATYGLAKLVRSTTPANTLDVSATGEAGLDFDNIKDASGAHTLTNITVPTVTTLTGHTAQTGDSFGRLGAPAGASVSADIAANKSELDGLQGTDGKCVISTDAQDLSGSLDVNAKTLTDGAITAAKLGADCITNAKIADNAIAVENIKDAAITAAKLAGDCITAAKIANAAIDNATFAADVGSTAYATNIIALAVRKALDEINLDHLMKVAVGDKQNMTEVVDATVLAHILTKTDGDMDDFDPTTDSLEAIRDVAPHGTAMRGTDNAALAATALSTAVWTAAKAAFLDHSIATVDTVVDGIQTDLDNAVDGLGALKALIDALNDLSAAQVNAEVCDVLKTDTLTEPAQGAPGVNISMEEKIAWLYKFLRNKITDDGTTIKVYNDAGAVVDHKATVGEAAGTVTRGEFGTGP